MDAMVSGRPDRAAQPGRQGRTAGDAATLLRRIERHVPLAPRRVVLALVRRNRSHVVRASWIDPPADLERDLRAGRALEGRTERPGALIRDALGPLADPRSGGAVVSPRTPMDEPSRPGTSPATPGSQSANGVVLVRCRTGRLTWLPDDLAWCNALVDEAARLGLTVLDWFLVTEYGWRGGDDGTAGQAPALAA